MKKTVLTLMWVALAFPVMAGENPVKAKFYDFGSQVINGEIKNPGVVLVEGDRKIRHDRLLHLKKSFLASIAESGSDPALK